jgi:hypothetical protein
VLAEERGCVLGKVVIAIIKRQDYPGPLIPCVMILQRRETRWLEVTTQVDEQFFEM